jgi:hypothetical protein
MQEDIKTYFKRVGHEYFEKGLEPRGWDQLKVLVTKVIILHILKE